MKRLFTALVPFASGDRMSFIAFACLFGSLLVAAPLCGQQIDVPKIDVPKTQPTPIAPAPIQRYGVAPVPIAPTPIAPAPIAPTPINPVPIVRPGIQPAPIQPTPIDRLPVLGTPQAVTGGNATPPLAGPTPQPQAATTPAVTATNAITVPDPAPGDAIAQTNLNTSFPVGDTNANAPAPESAPDVPTYKTPGAESETPIDFPDSTPTSPPPPAPFIFPV